MPAIPVLQRHLLSVAGVLIHAALLLGAEPPPVAAPPAPSIPAARDVEFPGRIQLHVDATQIDHRVFDVTETVPVTKNGRLTLLFPKWIPGGHTPRGAIDQIGGLRVTANGTAIPWSRDPIEVTAIHMEVPDGAQTVELRFQFLSATQPRVGRVVVTPEMLNLQWLSVAFYPAGHYVSRITVDASLKLPDGWSYACALSSSRGDDGQIHFETANFETLMDSPLFAGRYYQQHLLTPPGQAPVRLNLFADKPDFLQAKPEHVEAHRRLVQQAYKVFGGPHYDRYEFLVGLTETLGGIGLEHHRSSENVVSTKYFTEWEKSFSGRHLLPHEFTHSWNGKFRRGADLWTPDYHQPMRNSLLWVYEGQTTYWGLVLAARSGIMTSAQALDAFAYTAAVYDRLPGRQWRPLTDTTFDPIIANRKPLSWPDYQRSEDYYREGQLIWLEVDTLIRELSGERKSLDDFALLFFGTAPGRTVPLTYQFDDVVQALNDVTAYDWRSFLRSRVEDVRERAPLEGLERGGYRLAYTDEPTESYTAAEKRRKAADFTYSLGLTVGEANVLSTVNWGGPAFQAGLRSGVTLVAVNGESYEADKLKSAIRAAAKPGSEPIEALIKDGDRYRTYRIEYHGGLRYPRLERITGPEARLDRILAPRPN